MLTSLIYKHNVSYMPETSTVSECSAPFTIDTGEKYRMRVVFLLTFMGNGMLKALLRFEYTITHATVMSSTPRFGDRDGFKNADRESTFSAETDNGTIDSTIFSAHDRTTVPESLKDPIKGDIPILKLDNSS